MGRKIVLGLSLIMFLVLFPLVNSIDFYQNDDWVYYATVENFLGGELKLHPYVGPTFFVQGLIAVTFSTIFSTANLPILTLLVSIINFLLLVGILTYFLNKRLLEAVLYGLIFAFNPLTTYLTLGFMTGTYFVFFMLLSLFCYLFYEKTKFKWVFWITLFISFLGLLVRQVSLMIPLGISIYSIYKKRYNDAFVSFITFIVFYMYYSYIFPLTPRILEVPLQYHHLLDFDYVFSTVYGILIILAAFLFPMVLNMISFKMAKEKFFLILAVAAGIYFIINFNFLPQKLAWDEFPYFQNTFERAGLYPRGIAGTKYQFKFNYDLYRYWDITSKVLVSLALSYFVFFRHKMFNIYSVLISVYVFLLLIVETFYDRYIYILIPIVILFIAQQTKKLGNLKLITLISFTSFILFFSYQLSNDFVLGNNYVWERSEQLVNEGVEPSKIHGTNAWKLTYRNTTRDYDYFFSYDSPGISPEILETYSLIESHIIDFPFSIFINPYIYLYGPES